MKLTKILSVILVVVFVFSVMCVPASAQMISFKLKFEAGLVCGAEYNTPQTVFRDLFESRNIKIYSGGKEIEADSDVVLGTGFSIKLDNKSIFTVVVMGDVDGDGDISSMDYVLVKRAVLGTSVLGPAGRRAADVAPGEELRAINYLKVKRAYFGTYAINSEFTCDPYESSNPGDGWSEGWV